MNYSVLLIYSHVGIYFYTELLLYYSNPLSLSLYKVRRKVISDRASEAFIERFLLGKTMTFNIKGLLIATKSSYASNSVKDNSDYFKVSIIIWDGTYR
jgi:hypothetical protein